MTDTFETKVQSAEDANLEKLIRIDKIWKWSSVALSVTLGTALATWYSMTKEQCDTSNGIEACEDFTGIAILAGMVALAYFLRKLSPVKNAIETILK